MIKARHTWFGKQVFDRLVPFLIKRHFRDFVIEEAPDLEDEKPVLILANHFSWWDGFTHYYLNRQLFRKRFHVMMLEDELTKRPLFTQAGAYGVRKGGRDVIETLDYTVQLLNDPYNLVLIFPTGQIQSLYRQEMHFQKGIGRILKDGAANCLVLFSFILPEYGSYPKPTLHSYIRKYRGSDFQLKSLEAAFGQQLEEVLKQHIKMWG